jgi:hypothetical protein
MGRDTWKYRAQERAREERKRKNPIWRGVGCLMVVILTMVGYFFGGWFLAQNGVNGWVYLPPEIVRPSFAGSLPPFMFPRLVITFLFFVLSLGAISLAYAVAFPIQPGETDVPPLPRRRPRRR